MSQSLKTIGSFLLDLLYPPKCALCGVIGSSIICENCRKELQPYFGKTCQICGVPIYGEMETCPSCLGDPPPFSKAIFYSLYEGKMEELIKRFKFKDRPRLASPLAGFLARLLREHSLQADLLTFVPLSSRRKRERGYNQAQLLAKSLSLQTGIPWAELLLKVKDTPAQSKLPRQKRLANVKGAFVLKGGIDIKGKRVALVDDVLTTGATAGECARLLKMGGAEEIYILTLARGTGTT